MKKEKTVDDFIKKILKQIDEINVILDRLEKAEGEEMFPERIGTA